MPTSSSLSECSAQRTEKPPLHNPEVRELLAKLGFECHGESRKGVHYYRPLQDGHLSLSLILGPTCTLSDLVDAIHRAGEQGQARHISYWFKMFLLSIRVGEEAAYPLLSLLEEPVKARHAILSMGPLLELERAQWPQEPPQEPLTVVEAAPPR